MLTLTLYRGYPGSGKKHQAYLNAEFQGGVVIDRDTIRKMHFGKYWGLKRKQEETVSRSQDIMIESAIKHGSHVHVPDTNLNPENVKRLINLGLRLGVHVKIVDVETPAIDCVKRMYNKRLQGEQSVPDKVIWDMARRYPMPWPQIITLSEDESSGLFVAIGH